MKCRHCGYDIRPGEAAVRDWIHSIGFYQCPGMWGRECFAEPEVESTDPPQDAEIVGDVEYDSIRDEWRPVRPSDPS